MPRNERYYSQQYSLVDNPSYPNPSTENHNFQEYNAQAYGHESELDSLQKPQFGSKWWQRRNKWTIGGAIVAAIVAIALIIGLAVGLTRHKTIPFSYTPSNKAVTSEVAYTLGGATTQNVNNTDDGIGAGTDEYTYYSGNFTFFPDPKKWVSFGDMWAANLKTLQTSCQANNFGDNNSPEIIQQIYDAIQNRSTVSHVDHRFILAIILQESHGCVRVVATDNGVRNPGLMQSHDGHSYDSQQSWLSILAMVQDGTQGTATGDGLVQDLDYYSSPYTAARAYNSGYVPKSGNLTEAAGATACYVSDVANRLTGWVYAETKCHEPS